MTIDNDTSPVDAVFHSVRGGAFRLRITSEDRRPGQRYAEVLNDRGERIGDAHDMIYGGRGWAVHTIPYAGFVSAEQVELIE